MSITLSSVKNLSRVRVALSGLPDGTVQVQTSLSGSATDAVWQKGIVAGGKALPVVSGAAQLDDYDGWASDRVNHYRAVPIDPPAGLLVGSGTASTPDDASLDVTGDITLIAHITTADNWTTGTVRDIVRKWDFGSPDLSYRFRIGSSDTLNLLWSTDGSTSEQETSTAAPSPPTSGELVLAAELDVDNGASGYDVRFWTAPSVDGPWTQLGDTITGAGTTSIANSAAPLVCNEGNSWDHSNHRTQVWSGLAITDPGSATLVADPRFDQQDGGTTSFDDAPGLTWTIAGDAEIVGIWQDSIAPSLDGELWLKSRRYPLLNVRVRPSQQGDDELADRSGAFGISGRSLPVGVSDLPGGRDHVLTLLTKGRAEEDALAIRLRVEAEWFLHVPGTGPLAELMPGSMHVLVGRPRRHRAGEVSDWVLWSLPVTEQAPPDAEVVGRTLTVQTVLRLYGTPAAVVSAHPTYADLLSTVGSPDDVFAA